MGGAVGRAVGCFCGEAGREDEADVNRCAEGVAGGLIDCGRGVAVDFGASNILT